MSINVAVSEAKAHLSDLVSRVQAGERITITVRGEPAIDLVVSTKDEAERRQKAGERLLAMMGRGGNMTQEEVREARAHGRR